MNFLFLSLKIKNLISCSNSSQRKRQSFPGAVLGDGTLIACLMLAKKTPTVPSYLLMEIVCAALKSMGSKAGYFSNEMEITEENIQFTPDCGFCRPKDHSIKVKAH